MRLTFCFFFRKKMKAEELEKMGKGLINKFG